MLIEGVSRTNMGIDTALLEVPETGVYRSADKTESRFYTAGTKVSRHEFELLQMGGAVVIGEAEAPYPEGEAVTTEVDGETVEGVVAPIELAEPNPEAKAEPHPENKAEKAPKNKAE